VSPDDRFGALLLMAVLGLMALPGIVVLACEIRRLRHQTPETRQRDAPDLWQLGGSLAFGIGMWVLAEVLLGFLQRLP
jgi:hypothetical protein